MSHPDDTLPRALVLLDAGNADEALSLLRPLLGYPRDVAETPDAVRAFARIARATGDNDLAVTVEAVVVARGMDAAALFAAGYALYERKLFGFAASLLARAHRIEPKNARIVAELASALEGLRLHAEAVRIVDASGLPENDPFLAYLSGFYRLMSGNIDGAEVRLRAIAGVEDETVAFARNALEGMVLRARAFREHGIDLGDRALTAWHAIINGSVLLHESPYGHDKPMHGRYAFVQDSPSLMREGLERLGAVLRALRVSVPRVIAPPGRPNRILALAAGRILGMPVDPWVAGDSGPGLVIAWNLDAVKGVDVAESLQMHGRLLFAHASSWVEPFPYAPDVTTFLYQTVIDPFASENAHEEALAEQIVNAPAHDGSVTTIEQVIAVAQAPASLPDGHRIGLLRGGGSRNRQRVGSPVPSPRFV